MSLRAIINNYTHFDIRFLKSCLRKGKMKREKRRGRKMAKRTQKRVSLLSGLSAGAALQVLIMGGIRLRAGLWQKWGHLGHPLQDQVYASTGCSFCAPFLLCPHSSQAESMGGIGPCLAH